MPMSLTALSNGSFPPGSFEAYQQERLRRVQKIKEEREREKYRNLVSREIRLQTETVQPAKGTNNNNKPLTATPIVNKSASAKIPLTSSLFSSVSPVKKSKSTGLSPVTKKTKKSRSTIKFPSKASFKASTSRKASTSTSRKLSKQSFQTTKKKNSNRSSYSKIISTKPNSIESKSRLTAIHSTSTGSKIGLKWIPSDSERRKEELYGAPGNTQENKVTFSYFKTSPARERVLPKNSDFYCPVTTPVSILKNREKVDTLCKSTLKPSNQSLENLQAKSKQSKSKVRQRRDENGPEMKIAYKPSHESQLKPPQPNIPVCNAFPGTKEWDEYWANYTVRMEEYSKEMVEYERKGAEMFGSDIALFKKEALKVANQKAIYKHLGAKGIEVGIIPPPPIESKVLKGFQLFNGYIMKSKNLKGIVTNLPGSPTGVRFEVDIRGIKPEDVLIQKDHNLLTLAIDQNKFLRIGTRSGKLAGDIEIWPPIDGLLIIDAP